ncbi:AhpC/TSA family protein [Mucilaginibacter sp. Bleaf8]|uniref:TlpA disulfide reductase family protein n=1 Tax=Mucilaginibacter sp. Bleaf8 TaxID=2834430 RepID=UPI001BCC5E6B|nr:TlpA disulfide reductase family protein [Mucilaginibacter sp. Bleaf8]MBS7563172.1 AhpC/TSA family protein [Mucilaginibacter sp. Bleaf8]
MNNKNLFTAALLAVAALSACKDNKSFTISGTIKNPEQAKKVYLLQADSTQISIVDSTTLSEDGKFKFKRQSPSANLFKLRAGGVIFDFIAQNGQEIDFETDLKDQGHTYQIEGSDESDKIKEFNSLSNKFMERSTKISDEIQQKAQYVKNQDSLMMAYQPQIKAMMGDYSKVVLKFLNENRKSLAAFYAAMSLDQREYEQQLVTYANEIKNDFKDNTSVQRFVKQMEKVKPISVGHAAPDFTIGSLDGKQIKLSDYKGKYVMLDFWASWCVPCRNENPNVVRLYNQYKDKGLNILGISLDEDKAKWQSAIAADNLTWQHASDLKNFDGPTERLFQIEAIPSNFIIDPQGKIIAKNITGKDLEDFLNKTFAKL